MSALLRRSATYRQNVTHNIEEMKEYLKSALIVILPIIFWFCILATGYGAQSLSQLIEIPIVLIASITIAYYLKNQNIYKIIGAIFLFVLLLRCLMPQIPE